MIRLFPLVLLLTLAPVLVSAQSLGTFRWQLEPYCNIVTLAVTPSGGVFEVEGTDDQCGAATAASASGTAFLNPNGSIGFGLNIVTSPSATPVHVEATIGLSTLHGTWHDSAGATGTFRFTPGAATGGAPRPATGSIGAASVNSSQVQLRIDGSCAPGTFMQSAGQSGSVVCGPESGDIADVSAGPGLTGGGVSGSVNLALPRTGNGAFLFDNDNGFVARSGGYGARVMWFGSKAAFRAGTAHTTQWDDANVGTLSAAFGRNTIASTLAFAAGDGAVASGWGSVAMGVGVTASGDHSVVLGANAVTTASADGSFVFGDFSTTNDLTSFRANEFLVRAVGGTRLYSNQQLTAGVSLAPGAGSWASVSDVNMKENFRDLGGDDVLAKIARMPIREWSYKTQDAAIRHVGPTAQDFHAAFGLGEDPLRISTIDADGIALRAVQALEARTRLTDERYRALEAELSVLRDRLAQLEARKP